jgi:FixJ family two-component response regulator
MTAPLSQSPRMVLIVDDDDSVRKSLTRLFKQHGYGVETFGSAGEFLARQPCSTPVCLLLDLHLPGLNGLQLQQQLSANHLPIIFMTGDGNVPMSVAAMKGGAVDFLLKPVAEDVLLSAVKRALCRSRDRQADRAESHELENRYQRLTPRECEVLTKVVAGLPNKVIAAELGIVEQTVKIHRGRVMHKLEADSLAHLVRIFGQLGLNAPPPRLNQR